MMMMMMMMVLMVMVTVLMDGDGDAYTHAQRFGFKYRLPHYPTMHEPRDPDIRLQKSEASTLDSHVDPRTHHPRPLDVGIGIQVFVPCYRAGPEVEYYGEYLGHGLSKTAFELQCPGERFHGTVLKVARRVDMESEVFTEASKYALTTSILYNCTGRDGSKCYHCWITERTIPLNQFCRHDGVDKQRCSLAAFHCMLEAACRGLYLSDCHFYNFGVWLTDNATEHRVVIIDAGSRGINPGHQWQKSTMNVQVIRKFWKACAEVSARNEEIMEKWRTSASVEGCLEWVRGQWRALPILTTSVVSIVAVRQAMLATEMFRRAEAQRSSGYKIMEMVGRFAGQGEWNAAFAMACYRAAEAMHVALLPEESEILDELYSRIIKPRRRDDELYAVMAFWARLYEYREQHRHHMPQNSADQTVTRNQARDIL